MALDATARTVAERAVRLSEQNYRLLVEEAPYAICRTSASGQILQANRAMMEMLGYEPGSESALLERELPSIFRRAGRAAFAVFVSHGSLLVNPRRS